MEVLTGVQAKRAILEAAVITTMSNLIDATRVNRPAKYAPRQGRVISVHSSKLPAKTEADGNGFKEGDYEGDSEPAKRHEILLSARSDLVPVSDADAASRFVVDVEERVEP